VLILRSFPLAALLAIGILTAQQGNEDVNQAIQAATTAKNPATLEEQAAAFEARKQYDPAQKLLAAALTLRAQISGDQSAEYGLCLLKLGTLEHKLIHTKESAAYYARAVRLLPGRPEAARAFLYLGITAIGAKDYPRAGESLQKAQDLDASLAGPVLMWTAYMHERQDESEQAEAKYKAALAFEAGDSLDSSETLKLYGRFLENQGRDQEARTVQARASAPGSGRNSPLPKTEIGQGAPFAYRVGGGVTPPSVVQKVDPPYSEEARVAKVSGTVLLQVVIGADGHPQNMKVLRDAGFGLDDCAVASVSQWLFKPGQKDGAPVPVYATIEVNFRLL
jgi:TonB family protein